MNRNERTQSPAAALRAVERNRHSVTSAATREKLARTKLEAAIVQAEAAGASQREIAAAASVTQPYVCQLLARHRGRFMPRSRLGYLLVAKKDEVVEAMDLRGVSLVRVFGSVARGEDGPDSDIDLMIDVPPNMGLLGLSLAEQDLRGILGVRVDLVPSHLMRSALSSTAAADAVLL